MASASEFDSILHKIESPGDKPGATTGPERVRRVLSKLGLLPRANDPSVILIAGTNGKGSVAKTLETLFQVHGESVGLFTSPHLIEATERIRTHGADLTREEFIAVYRNIEAVAVEEQLGRFETMTVMMAEAFWGGRVRPRVARAVIEAGVGGRLDPTRGIPHGVSVITRIGLDHQDLLGGSLLSIAREKLHVIDTGNLAVYVPLLPEVNEALEERQAATDARYIEAPSFAYRVEKRTGGNGETPVWIIETPWGDAPLALRGARAVANTSVALKVMSELGFDMPRSLAQLHLVQWPGRMERFRVNGKEVYLSGDHNPQGAESLAEILSHFDYDRVRLVVGVGQNKPADEMLEAFTRLPRSVLSLCKTPFRSANLDFYGEWLKQAQGGVFEDPLLAVDRTIESASARDLVLITGSLYLVGEVRKQILAGRFGAFTQEWVKPTR